jgi:hypothetical protein
MKPRDSQKEDPALPASPYVNHFEVAHNPFEFLIEFGHYRPSKEENDGNLVLHTCLAISPPYAKMLSDLLVGAVEQFEKCNGLIASVPEAATPFDIVLHSLPEFEERARKLRARRRVDGAEFLNGDAQPLSGKGR